MSTPAPTAPCADSNPYSRFGICTRADGHQGDHADSIAGMVWPGGSSRQDGHDEDCPARYGCCPNDEYGCAIHIPSACNCGHEQADSDD